MPGKEIETISSSDYIPWEKHPHRDPIGFVLRLGRALHTFGYSADRLEAVLTKCSERLGIDRQDPRRSTQIRPRNYSARLWFFFCGGIQISRWRIARNLSVGRNRT